ncbi:peptidase family m20/M25/M40 domain-containing protein [Phthorimaea operculella]|nr:peptidase family m20/M25/M40 domain-containing protein [Phthorimaea operculella]
MTFATKARLAFEFLKRNSKMRWLGAIFCLAVLGVAATAAQAQGNAQDYANNESVKLFQEYLRINTTTYGDLSKAVDFWKARAKEQGLEIKVNEFTKGFPVVVIKWPGTDDSLSSIMLNSHMDVVPANPADGWTYPPFDAHLDENGDIWGRGTQDMKSVSIQYFEALRRIKAKNAKLLRNVYMTLMPDEEVGAHDGMIKFLESDAFKALNVGLELDEGGAFKPDSPLIPLLYQDKVPWQIQIDCYGTAVHGSSFPPANQTAVGRCLKVVDRLMKFREQEYEKYVKNGGTSNSGSYTSVNLNIIRAGTATNVVPGHVSLTFDIRLAIAVNEEEFEKQLKEWIVSDNVNMTYINKGPQSPATLITKDDPWWETINSTATQLGLQLFPLVPNGATDARFVRTKGYPGFGFSPMPATESRLHQVNERLSAATFLKGIDVYETLVGNLANIPKEKVSTDPSRYIVRTNRG